METQTSPSSTFTHSARPSPPKQQHEDSELVTWAELLADACDSNGDNYTTDIECTASTEKLHRQFDGGYGSRNGPAFVAWSESYVYFSHVYDGRPSVQCVPRHPNLSGFVPYHIGDM